MLIAKGRPAPSEPWHILEVAIGQSPDVIAIRLHKEIKRLHEKCVEALVPFRRNAAGEAEWIVEHVYVRGLNGSLRSLKRVPGIEFIREETADQEWINRLMEAEQKEFPRGLQVGDFVRILTGPCARLCGTITAIKDQSYTVTVEMRTKRIRVHTTDKNLQAVECPPEHRNFFYFPSFCP